MTVLRPRELASDSGHDTRILMLVFCASFLAIMWAALVKQISYDRIATLERRQAENNNLALLFEEHVRRTLAVVSVTLKDLEIQYRRSGSRLDLARYIRDRQEEFEPYSVLSVIDPNGDLVLSNIAFEKPQNYRDVENFQFHRDDASREVFVAKPRLGVAKPSLTIYLTRRMNNPDGSFGGTVGVGMDPQYLSRIYDRIDLGPDSVVSVVGLDGVIRARRSDTRTSKISGRQDMLDSDLFAIHLKKSDHGNFRATSPIDGVQRLYSFRSIAPYSLIVLVGASESATLASFEERRNTYLLVAGVTSAMILSFAAMLLVQMSRGIRANELLRASEERYALVERATYDGIWDRDLKSGEAYVSPRAKALFGYRDDELPAQEAAFFERVHPLDADRVRQSREQSIREGVPYRIEYRLRHKDGSYRWLQSRGEVIRDEEGVPARMIGSITDITGFKESELQIREQARLQDLIFDHSLDCIVLLDKDYNFLRVSRSYAAACQRQISDFPGRNHFELFPSDLEQEIEPYRREKRIYSRTARPFVFPDHPEWGATWWDLALVPLLDQEGEIELFLFTLKDVTSRVHAEEQVRDYTTRLRALSGRVVAMQEEERRSLARELHDEIGQSLTAIKIHLQAMAGKRSEMPFDRDNLDEAISTVAQVLEQVRSLSMNLRPLPLDDLGLTVALSTLVARNAETAGWRAHFEENLGAERLDPDLELACYRVAQEALTNVMRHAGASEVWVALLRDAQALLVTVRDNGSGFDPEVSPSSSAAPHLGLLGIEERVRSLAGRFEVRAGAGQGTEVRASFPLAPTAKQALS